uniref:Uncharacterized protein n=1 Tax=Picea sitchensis TaxID=3332 RepID=A9NTI4_PICSI|nr:unknown [Picea sitchensis]
MRYRGHRCFIPVKSRFSARAFNFPRGFRRLCVGGSMMLPVNACGGSPTEITLMSIKKK